MAHNSNIGFFVMIGSGLLAAVVGSSVGWRRDCRAQGGVQQYIVYIRAVSYQAGRHELTRDPVKYRIALFD